MEDLQAELDKTFLATINKDGLWVMLNYKSIDKQYSLGDKYDKLKLYHLPSNIGGVHLPAYSSNYMSAAVGLQLPNYMKLSISRNVNIHRVMTEETFEQIFGNNQVMKNLFSQYRRSTSMLGSGVLYCFETYSKLWMLEQIAIEWLKVLDENEKAATW